MVRPGDIVMFDDCARELFPKPGELYIMCNDGSFQHWPTNREALGWEFLTLGDRPHIRIAQFGFQPVEVRVKIVYRHLQNPPKGCGTTQGTINEQHDDGEPSENSVLS